MKMGEKELFKALCSFKAKEFDAELLKYATPTVLGHLFFNRMSAVAYGVMKEQGVLGKVNREFRNSLRGAYEQNIEKNNSFFWCVEYLGDILSKSNASFVMLKGAYLCRRYPRGYRTSNDIDLLVVPENVAHIGMILKNEGFLQGNVRNDCFIPATRREIIESKMTRGETVPYIKEVGLPGMKFLEVDINFSLDYKPDDSILLRDMVKNAHIAEIDNFRVQTLREEDFFVHLCSHLYKEATTLPWVEMMRDMTLYKYADIYMILNDLDKADTEKLFECANDSEISEICAFAVGQMSKLFDFENMYATERAADILCQAPDLIDTVISPKDKKTYIFEEKNIQNRFFAEDRKSLLREVKII